MSLSAYASFLLRVVRVVGYWMRLLGRKLHRAFQPPARKSFKGEIILVTGGSSGIGRGICHELVREERDVTVVVWSRSLGRSSAVVEELKGMGVKRAVGYAVDVGDERAVRAGAEQVRREVGEVTVLVNNAGMSGDAVPGWEMSGEMTERVLRVNLLAHCATLREFFPAMLRRGAGHVVTTCSIFSFASAHSVAAYAASKHALLALIESMKEDVRALPAQPRIHFTTAFPNYTATQMTHAVNVRSDKYPFLIRESSAAEVARRIVRGVVWREEDIYFPAIYRFAPAAIALLDSWVYRKVLDAWGIEIEQRRST